jgi:glycerophosphoryl diester phosphodiesterase
MGIGVAFCVINGLTAALLISPLFLFFSSLTVIFLILILPLTIFFLYSYFSLPQSQSSVDQFRNITIAHRGGHPLVLSSDIDDFPENTIAAYRWASTIEGADGIELDVWLSRDNIPMVSHDGYLEHTFSECREFISSLTCAELKKLKYLKKNKRDIYDQTGCEVIPTLEEVINFLEPTKLKLSMTIILIKLKLIFSFLLVIEIKEIQKISVIAKIIDDLFKRYPFLYDRAYCAAFHPANLYAIRRANSRITTAYLFVPDVTTYIIRNSNQTPHPKSIVIAQNVIFRWMIDSIFMWFGSPVGLEFLGANLACVEQRHVSQNFVDEYKKAGIIVYAWCVNEPEQKRWLRANEVSIITDTLFDKKDK